MKSTHATAQEWQMFLHHGTGYVTGLNPAGDFASYIDATVPGGSTTGFAPFYYHNRFWETGGASRVTDTLRLRESSSEPSKPCDLALRWWRSEKPLLLGEL